MIFSFLYSDIGQSLRDCPMFFPDVFYCFLQINFIFAYYNQIIKYERERKS